MKRRHNINLLSLSLIFSLCCFAYLRVWVYCLLADDNNNIVTNTLRLIAAFVPARPNSPKVNVEIGRLARLLSPWARHLTGLPLAWSG